mgnify:CR=1 FL=1
MYGSYTVVNHWPQKLSEQRTLYLDQFTGQTIANATADQDGALKAYVEATSPKVEIEGKTYYTCCPGCAKKLQADPAKFLKKPAT